MWEFLVVVAVVVAAVGSGFVFVYASGAEDRAKDDVASVRVLVAIKTILPGESASDAANAGKLLTTEIPEDQKLDGATDDGKAFTDSIALTTIYPGEQLLLKKFGSIEDIEAAGREWCWLLERLGYHLGDDWGHGRAWELGSLYLVVEAGPDVEDGRHERRRPGVNHLAFHGGSRAEVDAVVTDCAEGGWTLMFADRHPYAGGPDHYAAYLESGEGFEVELVAD